MVINCNACIHKDVCLYKDSFMAAQIRLDNFIQIEFMTNLSDNNNLTDILLKDVSLECKLCNVAYGSTIRPTQRGSGGSGNNGDMTRYSISKVREDENGGIKR